MTETPEDLYERLWDAIAEVRDASPRIPNDAATDDIVNVAVNAMVREIRRLADELDIVKNEMREVDGRTIRSSALGEGIRRLRDRADELDG